MSSGTTALLDTRFDGDTSSANAAYSDEAIQEVDNYLDSKRAYIGTNGKLLASVDTSVVSLILFNMTGP